MKKVFLALMCVAAIALVGCNKATTSDPVPGGTKGSTLTPEKIATLDNTTEKCWHVGSGGAYGGQTAIEEGYMWGTERDAAEWAYECYQMSKAFPGSYEYSYKESDAKTEEECDKLDKAVRQDEEADYACWSLSYDMAGATITAYYWNDEEGMDAMAAAYKSRLGVDCKIAKADAKDEDACIALNNQNPGGGETPGGDEDLGELACWKISWSFGGDSDVEYMWNYESAVKAIADGYTSIGGSASYEKTNKDEDNCEAE